MWEKKMIFRGDMNGLATHSKKNLLAPGTASRSRGGQTGGGKECALKVLGGDKPRSGSRPKRVTANRRNLGPAI